MNKMDENTEIDCLDGGNGDFMADGQSKQLSLLPDMGIEDYEESSLEVTGIERLSDLEVFKDYDVLKTLDDNDFKKHIAMVHGIGQDFDTIDQRLFNVIYKIADTYKFDRETYYVTKGVIKAGLGREKDHYEQLKESLEKLLNTKMVWNIFGADQKNKEWGTIQAGLIGAFALTRESNVIRFSIPDVIRELIIKPNIYANINHRTTNKLHGREIVLYEFFKGMLDTNKKDEKNVRIPDENLRRLLQALTIYPKRAMFIDRCLKKPLKRISDLSDIMVGVTRFGRENDYDFNVRRKIPKYNTKLALLPQPNTEIKELLCIFYVHIDKRTRANLIKFLRKKDPGVDGETMNEYIAANVKYAIQIEESKIKKTKAAIIIDAIKNDYAKYFEKKEEAARKKEKEDWNDVPKEILKDLNLNKIFQPEEDQKQEEKQMPVEPPPETLSERLKKINVTELPELLEEKLNTIREKYPADKYPAFKNGCKNLIIDDKGNIYMVVLSSSYAEYFKSNCSSITKDVFVEVKFENIMTEDEIIKYFFPG
jgi:hypothetical protein